MKKAILARWFVSLILLTCSEFIFAQVITNTTTPVVSVLATDPEASEMGADPGTFTVRRAGPTNMPVLVFYRIGGTASNGVDYEEISSTVAIPAGARNAEIRILPKDDALAEGPETVVIRLVTSPVAGVQSDYLVGIPEEAVVFIADDETPPVTNLPPVVRIVVPDEGAIFEAGESGATIWIAAQALDLDGYVSTVEFFEGTNSLGIRTNNPLSASPINPFFLVWSNVPPGHYTLLAQATDDGGATAISDPVHVTVKPTGILPVVQVVATDPSGSEIPEVPPGMGLAQRIDTATFKVWRTDMTDSDLTVYYSLGGTAVNGVDYVELPGSVKIPAGSTSANVEVEPIDDFLVEGTETVVLTLEPVACADVFPPPPGCYAVGPEHRATAYIRDNDLETNLPPVVTIEATDPKASETGPDSGTFMVTRSGNTSQRLVVYYSTGGTARNGADYQYLSNYVVIPEGSASADIMVTPKDDALVEGEETVLVQLRPPMLPLADDHDWWDPASELRIIWPQPYAIGFPSNAVVMIEDNDEAGTNMPPEVKISRPLDGSVFKAHANVTIVAEARDQDGFVSTVEFFEGTNSLGVASNRPNALWPINPFFLVWSNVPAGAYVLTALATDNLGAAAVSGPVRISVIETNTPPPPTNLPPVVTLVATDPIGSEGGNCFATTLTCRSNLIEATTAGFDAGFSFGTNICWTNIFCGTNTAAFKVRRSGGTDSELTVYYEIHGTASNGVDYVALPGTVTIPAGRFSARITVVPIDDELVEGAETVVLALTLPPAPSDPSVPAYRIGFPGKAAAIIADNDLRLPPCFRLRDGLFHVCLPGTIGISLRLETSTDLEHWTATTTEIMTEGNVHFVDPDAADYSLRFYRAVPQPMLIPED